VSHRLPYRQPATLGDGRRQRFGAKRLPQRLEVAFALRQIDRRTQRTDGLAQRLRGAEQPGRQTAAANMGG
jgi:hypothetical protein